MRLPKLEVTTVGAGQGPADAETIHYSGMTTRTARWWPRFRQEGSPMGRHSRPRRIQQMDPRQDEPLLQALGFHPEPRRLRAVVHRVFRTRAALIPLLPGLP